MAASNVAVIAASVHRATRLATTIGISGVVCSAADIGLVVQGCNFDVIIVDTEANVDGDTMGIIRHALRSGGALLNAVT